MTTKHFLGYLKADPPAGSRTGVRRISETEKGTNRAKLKGAHLYMEFRAGIFAVLLLFLMTACAPVQPKPDPLREEVTILQKQLLELQKLQIETKAKLEESSVTVNALSSKIAALEERSLKITTPAPPPIAPSAGDVSSQPVKKKTPAKKKSIKKPVKKVRRQE